MEWPDHTAGFQPLVFMPSLSLFLSDRAASFQSRSLREQLSPEAMQLLAGYQLQVSRALHSVINVDCMIHPLLVLNTAVPTTVVPHATYHIRCRFLRQAVCMLFAMRCLLEVGSPGLKSFLQQTTNCDISNACGEPILHAERVEWLIRARTCKCLTLYRH